MQFHTIPLNISTILCKQLLVHIERQLLTFSMQQDKCKLELPVAEPSVELTATCRSEPPKVEAKVAHSITTPSLSE